MITEVVWQYPATADTSLLNGAVVFTYSTLVPNGNPNPLPTKAMHLEPPALYPTP